ncbi:hypothetical protein [Phenylobacterium sp.]|uniref:hypothetical protein n=1 Tax=Phenylobacterium sp. TaxID=1871053 RepID=UPI00272FEC56|nr:hypothetical protein [Phenylobacterium sp.]MDP2214986.1 hypothetical protein [Phenylobacterium sp.]
MAGEFMTGAEIRDARDTLGKAWGLGRPLKMAEMARACRLGGRDPGATIRDYETGKTKISGPLSLVVELYLAGVRPPEGIEAAIAPRQGEEGR